MASAEQKSATGNGATVNHTIANGSTVQHQQQDQEQSKDANAKDLLPHLESLERIIKLPVVNAAWDKSQDVYGKVKGKNRVFEWAFTAAEDCVTRAVTTAVPFVTKLDRPIAYVDQTIVKGIEQLEVKAPIIKDTPQEIYNQAKSKVIDVVQPHLERVVKFKAAGQQKAASLKDLAWQKANEVLATQYGSLAVNGVDTTTALAERLLEYYFPKSESDVEEDNVLNIEDYDQEEEEVDARFIVAASTVFLSMSLRIITEIVEYIRRNPEIIGIIDRELNNFMCQFPPARIQSYTPSRQSVAYPIRSHVASIEMSPDRSSKSKRAISMTI
ncbi:lipid storage droplets surface-binding protein 2 isoform X4 [Drosophila tropicalis]|uniref:lipid storage droplets surface-binding protein 2 isoform X4 n=1 Tax=Drosophila tropicalis TaxID=46794 RepID=UPI0035AB7275